MTARGSAFDRLLDVLAATTGHIPKGNDRTRTARCPAHDDHNPSLSVTRGSDRVLIRCQAGCDVDDVLAALELSRADLFDEPKRRNSPEPVTEYPYVDENGALLFVVERRPATADKPRSFPQRRPDGAGGWTWNLNGTRRVLYKLPAVLAAVHEGQTVYVVEGEKDVHSAERAGLVATCNPGGTGGGWRDDYSDSLKGATVIVVADRDDAGRKHAAKVAAALAGVAASVRVVEPVAGKDLTEHLAAGHTVDELVEPDASALPADRPDDPAGEDNDEKGKRTAAAMLVDLARERYTFGLSDGDEPFAVRRDLPSVAFMLRGGRGSLRAELAAAYLHHAKKPAPSQALADALLAMEGLARAGDPQPLALRVAERHGSLWLDLGDATGRAVQVSAGGWQVVDQPPVIFRRTATTGVLPTPARDGDLDRLWDLLTVPKDDRPLVAAWLVSLLMPELAHPVLCLLGEQGTGKTSAARLLSATVDPSPAQVRKPPRDADGWVTAATGSWVVALDNLSAIPEWLSDSLCRAATGDGDVRRKLYSDGELVVFAFRRAIIVNGIDLGALRDDLAERLLTLRLDRISATQRRYESDLDAAWAAAHPSVLGGLLDLAAACMRLFPSVRLDSKPRMADFGRVLAAVDKLLGTAGMARYLGQSAELAADALDSDPVLGRIVAAITTPFEGTSAELLARITPAGDDWRTPKGWPKDPRALTGLLRRRAPSLRRLGWGVDDLGRYGPVPAVHFRLNPPGSEIEVGNDACDAVTLPNPPATQRRSNDPYLTLARSPESWLCVVCSTRLDPVLIDEGAYTHPMCDLVPA